MKNKKVLLFIALLGVLSLITSCTNNQKGKDNSNDSTLESNIDVKLESDNSWVTYSEDKVFF